MSGDIKTFLLTHNQQQTNSLYNLKKVPNHTRCQTNKELSILKLKLNKGDLLKDRKHSFLEHNQSNITSKNKIKNQFESLHMEEPSCLSIKTNSCLNRAQINMPLFFSSFIYYNIFMALEKQNEKLEALKNQNTNMQQQNQKLKTEAYEKPNECKSYLCQEMNKKLFYISKVIEIFNSQFLLSDPVIDKKKEEIKNHFLETIQNSFYNDTDQEEPQQLYLTKAQKYEDCKTLVLDLDETLIHRTDQSDPSDVVLDVEGSKVQQINQLILNNQLSFNIRPYAQHFLQTMSKNFELIIFTASSKPYADLIIDHIDPMGFIQHRLYRDHCVLGSDGTYYKDLRILTKNRDLKDILIVDNQVYSFAKQIENGIPILPFYQDKKDMELYSLIQYLKQFKNVLDVRELNTNLLKLNQFWKYNDPVKLLKELFINYI